MKTLVIYDSVFGNTEKIARAIAESLGNHGSVEVLKPGQVGAEQLAGFDLLVVGSPTRGFRPTEAMSALLKKLRPNSLRGMKAAAFDTRLKADELKGAWFRLLVKTGGYAARRIADQLKKAGANLIVLPEGFYVEDSEGPLKAGELERASSWATALVDSP